jgi:DNA polymerase-3 subunit beta
MPANKLTVERAHLVAALTQATKAVETRNTYPILANVYLAASDDRLTLRATDLDIEITTSVPAQGELAATTVPARTLLDIARKMPAGA